MIRKLLFFTCLALLVSLLAGCQHGYTISGTADASGIEGRSISLRLPHLDGQWSVLDSCEVMHGLFSMKGKSDSVVVATLFVGDVPLMPVVVESGNLHIDISNIALRASGTRLNNRLYSFIDSKNALDARVAELGHTESRMIMDGKSSEVVTAYVDSVYNVLSSEMNDMVSKFISGNYTNVLGLCGFGMLTNGFSRPTMTPLVRQLLDGAPASFLENPLVRHYIEAANADMASNNLAER